MSFEASRRSDPRTCYPDPHPDRLLPSPDPYPSRTRTRPGPGPGPVPPPRTRPGPYPDLYPDPYRTRTPSFPHGRHAELLRDLFSDRNLYVDDLNRLGEDFPGSQWLLDPILCPRLLPPGNRNRLHHFPKSRRIGTVLFPGQASNRHSNAHGAGIGALRLTMGDSGALFGELVSGFASRPCPRGPRPVSPFSSSSFVFVVFVISGEPVPVP